MSTLIKNLGNQTFYQNIDFTRFSQYQEDYTPPMDYLKNFNMKPSAQKAEDVSNLKLRQNNQLNKTTNSFLTNLKSSKELTTTKKSMMNTANNSNLKASSIIPTQPSLEGTTSKSGSDILTNANADSEAKEGMSSETLGMVESGLNLLGDIGSGISESKGINAPTTSTQDMRNKGMDTANKVMMSSGMPILMAIGAANMAIDKTGGYSEATSHDKELNEGNNLSTWTNIGNLAASFLTPGAGYFLKKTQTYDVSSDLANSSGFTGASADAQAVKNNFSGKKLSLGASKANSIIENAKKIDAQVQNTLRVNRDLMSASNAFDLKYKKQIEGGYSQSNSIKFGKEGVKLTIEDSKKDIKKITISQLDLELLKSNNNLENGKLLINLLFGDGITKVDEFKNGGTINIIPGGTLHAHKHHLEEVSDIYSDITTKGMPVVVYDEKGVPTQTAEIETSEVILHIKLTETLEKLKKLDTKESQIEAGKILAKELIKNTINYSKEYTDTLKTKKLKQNNEIHL